MIFLHWKAARDPIAVTFTIGDRLPGGGVRRAATSGGQLPGTALGGGTVNETPASGSRFPPRDHRRLGRVDGPRLWT